MKTYCFDIDGVICNIDSDEYMSRTPIPETIDLLNELRMSGHLIILNTGRHINHMSTTQLWLFKHKVPYDHIQFGKPVADFYIDDRAVRFDGKWTKKIKDLLL